MNKAHLKNHIINLFGWKTNRKIIVFESDDWGTIRMASKEAFQRLLKKGYPVDKCAYNSNDALENNDDLEKLGNVLLAVKDKNNRPAKFTINNIVANPDFDKIRHSDFLKYYFEPFTTTLKRYKNTNKVLSLYKKGIGEKFFQPQFHGREHVHVNRWLKALGDKEKGFTDAFKENMFSNATTIKPIGRRSFLDSFGKEAESEYETYENIIKEGTQLFKRIWGFSSKTFIAPCYVWSEALEPILKQKGIIGIQGTHVQRIPLNSGQYKIKKKYHYTGQKNKHGQFYLVRNVFFEPTEYGSKDAVQKALFQIDNAFRHKKPAIISSHRVNYIGSINPENRNKNLKLLEELLLKITNKYPNAEFMSSDELLMLL
jgi:hypothetical protein